MEIEKIAKEAAKHIRPHMQIIEEDFKERSEKLNKLLETDHSIIGTIVKAHLIVEFYITEYLSTVFPNCPFDNAKLSFYQKLSLIPATDASVAWLLPSIKQLNKIRNKFAHNIFSEVQFAELNEVEQIVRLLRDTSHKNVEKLVIDFSVISSSFLYRAKPEILKIFSNAYKEAMKS